MLLYDLLADPLEDEAPYFFLFKDVKEFILNDTRYQVVDAEENPEQ